MHQLIAALNPSCRLCPGYDSAGLEAITAGSTEQSTSNINTTGAVRWMDGEVLAPADHGHTNGPWLMDQLWPVWADWPAL